MWLLAGCTRDQSAPTSISQAPSRSIAPTAQLRRGGIEARFDQIAQSVSGFAGVAIDTANAALAHVYVTAVSERGSVRSSVTAMLADMLTRNPRRFRGTQPALQIHTVKYDFLELEKWRRILDNNSTRLGLESWAIDVRNNRIVAGVRDAKSIRATVAAMATLGIPDDGVTVTVEGPVVLTGSLTDHVPAPFAGVRITGGEGCTLGFTGSNIAGEQVFVTASHCTNTIAADDGGTFYQPTSAFSPAIGHEESDPTGIQGNGTNGCAVGNWCRYSDAAMIIQLSTPFKSSYVAITGSGNSFSDYEPITGAHTDPIQGELVSRVGSTTGYAQGTVTFPAKSIVEHQNGKNVEIAEATFATGTSGPTAEGGDSGGPVFLDCFACSNPLVPGSNPREATISGIEFAKDSAATGFFYSSLSSIYADFVNFTFAEVYGATSRLLGPQLITATGTYTWYCDARGGPGYTYAWEESDDGGATWHPIATTQSYSRTWTFIGSGTFSTFKLRVTATFNPRRSDGFDDVARSDPFDVVVRGQ